jgi:aldehyde dehydrogenase (NAD+)
MIHATLPQLGFGGVGGSGFGKYHGKNGFDTFTHYKAVVIKKTWFDSDLRYPPYSNKIINLLKKLV